MAPTAYGGAVSSGWTPSPSGRFHRPDPLPAEHTSACEDRRTCPSRTRRAGTRGPSISWILSELPAGRTWEPESLSLLGLLFVFFCHCGPRLAILLDQPRSSRRGRVGLAGPKVISRATKGWFIVVFTKIFPPRFPRLLVVRQYATMGHHCEKNERTQFHGRAPILAPFPGILSPGPPE